MNGVLRRHVQSPVAKQIRGQVGTGPHSKNEAPSIQTDGASVVRSLAVSDRSIQVVEINGPRIFDIFVFRRSS